MVSWLHYRYLKLTGGKTQGFGGVRNATTPSIISEVPYAEEVACGGYHTCVVTSNSLLFFNAFWMTGLLSSLFRVYCTCVSFSHFFAYVLYIAPKTGF